MIVYIPLLQAAGYTLSELLPLCRSSILQQRVLALNTLARITQRGRQGEYAGVIEGSVVSRLLEAEVPLLLRYALDDSNDAVFCVAIHALHSLLVLMPEEVSKFEYLVCDLEAHVQVCKSIRIWHGTSFDSIHVRVCKIETLNPLVVNMHVYPLMYNTAPLGDQLKFGKVYAIMDS